MLIGHVLIKVAAADHAAVVNFYVQALKPLGSEKLRALPNGVTAFGSKAPEWFVGVSSANPDPKVHVAFAASDRATVRAFHAAALAAGAQDNGAPGPRPQIHPDYYGAFVLDPVGNNIEAYCIAPGEQEKI